MTNLQITMEDQIENNKLYAIEIKNAVLNRLPRNIDITIDECEPDENEISCYTKFIISKNGKYVGKYIFSANAYNENYSFDTVVNAAVYSLGDFSK